MKAISTYYTTLLSNHIGLFFCKEGASIGLIFLKWGKSKVHQESLRLMLNDHEYLYTSLKNSFTTEIYNYRNRFPPDEFLLWEKMFIIKVISTFLKANFGKSSLNHYLNYALKHYSEQRYGKVIKMYLWSMYWPKL